MIHKIKIRINLAKNFQDCLTINLKIVITLFLTIEISSCLKAGSTMSLKITLRINGIYYMEKTFLKININIYFSLKEKRIFYFMNNLL
jgi:hypothetical protein